MRAVAALLLLVYHVIESGPWTAFPHEGLLQVFRMGWIGVDLFFVVSGFVIDLSAMQGALADAHWGRSFAMRHLRRIVPRYSLTCGVYLFLVDPAPLIHGPKNAAIEISTRLLFIPTCFRAPALRSMRHPDWSRWRCSSIC